VNSYLSIISLGVDFFASLPSPMFSGLFRKTPTICSTVFGSFESVKSSRYSILIPTAKYYIPSGRARSLTSMSETVLDTTPDGSSLLALALMLLATD